MSRGPTPDNAHRRSATGLWPVERQFAAPHGAWTIERVLALRNHHLGKCFTARAVEMHMSACQYRHQMSGTHQAGRLKEGIFRARRDGTKHGTQSLLILLQSHDGHDVGR